MDVSIRDLRINPAQCRTRIAAAGLAALALQMREPDPALDLLVKKEPPAMFKVLSGHRRWLAAMIARMASGDYLEGKEATIVEAYCDPDDEGWIQLSPELYDSMVKMVDDFTLPVRVWEGSDAEEVITLLRANMGAERPDLLGIARAFHVAIERDVSLEDLAQATGISVATADAIMGIPVLPTIFQQLLNNSRLDLNIVPDLDQLDQLTLETFGDALQEFVDLEIDPEGMDYSGRVRSALVNLRFESTPPKPKDHAPESFNRKRILNKLWTKARIETPIELAAALAEAGLHGRSVHQTNILSGISSTMLHFRRDNYGWGKLLGSASSVLDDLSCATCTFAHLPEARLHPPLELPCRSEKDFSSEGCIHWIPEGQGFHFRTPWGWATGSTAVETFKQLMDVWEKQRNFELGEDPSGSLGEDGADLTAMQVQRGAIRQFMKCHEEPPFTIEHLWATPCDLCRYKMEMSPVKSAPEAPFCAWSKGRRQLRFQAFWPSDDEDTVIKPPDMVIASCLQFAPAATWSEIIPEPDTAPPLPRDVLVHLITDLGSSANRETHSPHSRGCLQFLSGRPEKATGNHRRTFGSRFHSEKEGLSDGQIWQLLIWVLLEWQRGRFHKARVMLPFGTRDTRLFKIMELDWAVDLVAEIEQGEVEPEQSDD